MGLRSETSVHVAVLDATGRPARDGVGEVSVSRYTVALGNVPLIVHVLDELAGLGIARAHVIAAAGRGDALRIAIESAGRGGPPTTVDEAPPGAERRAVLGALTTALGEGPALLHPADALYGDALAAMLARYSRGDVDVALPAEASVASRHDPACGAVSESAIVLGQGARELLRSLAEPDADGEAPVAAMLHSDLRLAVCELPPRWSYDDSTDVLLAGNRLVLDELPARGPGEPSVAEGNELHGRVALGRGAFMSGCVIHGPVAIGDGAVLEDSFIGPYTSIGAGAVLSGAEIDNAIVLTQAEIRHPGQRIVASIIGQGACVSRSFELPRGMHLRLGPGSRVTLS